MDFTSRPRARKPITIASGVLRPLAFELDTVEECAEWAGFENWLGRPGPWIAGFDFPFGLPREAVCDLGLPSHYAQLVHHCALRGREGFRALLDGYRATRPTGNRYAHRATDYPAKSHSPLKLVNPPVGLMFLEGVPRLLGGGREPARAAPRRPAAYRAGSLSRICRASDGGRLIQERCAREANARPRMRARELW